MAIAGYAIGATQGYIYIRAEYPIAVKRLQIAIDQARERGLLGKNIFNSGFDFDIGIRLGAGAFVCGEETALMTSIEGKRGEPGYARLSRRSRACLESPRCSTTWRPMPIIPQIILKGADWFKSIGTENVPRHQGLRPGRQNHQHRPGGGPHGHHPAGDCGGDRRRHPQRGRSSRPLRPAAPPAAVFPPSSSTPPSTTTPSPPSAP